MSSTSVEHWCNVVVTINGYLLTISYINYYDKENECVDSALFITRCNISCKIKLNKFNML